MSQLEVLDMCQIYTNTDPMSYESRNRSIRINKVVTSIRLENVFWDILAQIALEEKVTVNQLITELYEELYLLYGEAPNFTSFLRVTCMNYMTGKSSQYHRLSRSNESNYAKYTYK